MIGRAVRFLTMSACALIAFGGFASGQIAMGIGAVVVALAVGAVDNAVEDRQRERELEQVRAEERARIAVREQHLADEFRRLDP